MISPRERKINCPLGLKKRKTNHTKAGVYTKVPAYLFFGARLVWRGEYVIACGCCQASEQPGLCSYVVTRRVKRTLLDYS